MVQWLRHLTSIEGGTCLMTPGRETRTCTLWAWSNIRILGFPHSSDGKECACSVGDLGSLPGSGKSPREGNGKPLPYSCLENPMD